MKLEVYITYCLFTDEEAFRNRDISFETDYRKDANEWIRERGPYLMKVCASCELGDGGAMEFAYGDTAAEARKELKSILKTYGNEYTI